MNRLIYWLKFILLYKNWLELIINRCMKVNSRIIMLRNNLKLLGSSITPLTVVVDETFILERYTPNFLKINKGDIVVDIGAHIGSFSIFASLQNAQQIYAYEPDRSTYDILEKNILNNNIKNIKAINVAITDKIGKAKFFLSENNGGSSIFNNKNGKLIDVQSIKLDDIFKQNKINKIDFLKIDCEGSEGLIFMSTKDKTWNKINKISLEYHNNVSPLNNNQLIKILEGNNFKTKYYKTSKDFGYIYGWK